jgi:hypothetical protein
MFKKRAVDFSVLEHVIKVPRRFDTYLKEVNENLDDEQIARVLAPRSCDPPSQPPTAHI